MSVIDQSIPELYSLAYNDNPFVFFSTNFGTGQRFEVSVVPPTYPTNPVLSTERIYPRIGITLGGNIQENKAYYDPKRILQTQVSTPVSIPSANHDTYFDAPEMYYQYRLFIREELLSNGVYSYEDSWLSPLLTVWNGVQDELDWLDFDYTDYDHALTNKLPLTPAPKAQYIDSNQSAFLYFFDSSMSKTTLRLTSYDANDVSLGNSVLSFSMSHPFGYFAIGTYDLENADTSNWTTDPFALLSGASYYTVTIENSNTYTFNLNQRCSKYDPIRLHWLNRLGGFDSFNFSLKSMEETDIDRRTYHSEHHRFTGTRWEYEKKSRGMTDYHVGTTKKLTVNTPFLTEAESIWMEDFATSTEIYQEVSNELVAMSGKPKMIAKQTSLNDKLMQYTFELEYSLTNMRQRG